MKVNFAKLSADRSHPLSRSDLRLLSKVFPEELLARIECVNFNNNRKTTQEARLVTRGTLFQITVNFCPRNLQSPLFDLKPRERKIVELIGGKIISSKRMIVWDGDSAKLFTLFLIAHELLHILYAEKYSNGKLLPKSSPHEETWCDENALQAVLKLRQNESE